MHPSPVLYASWAPFFSGAERALLVLLDQLDRSRYRPIVVVGTEGEMAAEVRARQIPVVHVPVVYAGGRTFPAWATSVSRLAWLARRERVALIHSNDVPSFQPVGYVARWLGLPAVTHVRFPDSAAGFGWFLKPGFARALFVSDSLRTDAIAEAPHIFAAKSETLYDGVHVPAPVDDAARAALRKELDLPLDRTLVVMAGQVSEVKGIWDFIDAAQLLIQRGVPASFVVLGDDLRNQGKLRRDAEQVVRDRGLSHAIHFLGFRPNAPRLMPAFDIVAVPSHVEPLGNATLEAMATARPVVGSRVGGIPEMIVDGVTGLLVPSQTPERLADALEQLVRSPEHARALGLAGRRRAIDAFSVDAHVARTQAIYDRFLHGRSADGVAHSQAAAS
jgi:glycosyltransferase involved in cell wall biosynthesis